MADNHAGDDDDDVSGNSRDMSSRFCVIDNGGDRRFDVGLSNRFRCALRSHCTPQTVMVFVAVVLGRERARATGWGKELRGGGLFADAFGINGAS